MKVVFRVDASLRIGSGHVMRCLTLADRLREQGAKVFFACREHVGNMNDCIVDKGYVVHRLPAPAGNAGNLEWNQHAAWLGVTRERDAGETLAALAGIEVRPDWLIVDHYALDRQWEAQLRHAVNRIMVIDDLADRGHDCDLLLDQNLYADMAGRYAGLLPGGCVQLLGPHNALLRPEFAAARATLPERSGEVRRILVFMGGSDPDNVTGKILDALSEIMSQFRFVDTDVIVGMQSPHRDLLRYRCQAMARVTFYENVHDMALRMCTADLVVGGGGTSIWERCALGLPSIIVSLAENQSPIAKEVAEQGAAVYLGKESEVDAKKIVAAIEVLMADSRLVRDIGVQASLLVDCKGVQRVFDEMALLS